MTELTDNIFGFSASCAGHSDFYDLSNHTIQSNAYVVAAEKTALIDVANDDAADDYIKNIENVVPVSGVDYLVCNYTGNEFAGTIMKILRLNPDIRIVGTIAAIKHIKEMINIPFKEHVAKNNAELDLGGGIRLKFIAAPNLPWPDTMLTYVYDKKLLFSGRMFSAYEGVNHASVMQEYFDDVLSLFKPFVRKAAEKILKIEANIVCPANGEVIINNTKEILSLYKKWTEEKISDVKKAAIVYPKSCRSTELMAGFISDKLNRHGIDGVLYPLSGECCKKVNDIVQSDMIIFGTNTVNKNASGKVLKLIADMNVLNIRGKRCFVFGSYGWGGEGLYLLQEYLKLLRLRVFEKPFGVCFNPSDEDYMKLDDYIMRFANTASENKE